MKPDAFRKKFKVLVTPVDSLAGSCSFQDSCLRVAKPILLLPLENPRMVNSRGRTQPLVHAMA